MKKIGFSIIGGGFMAKLHTLAISSYPKYFYPPAAEVERICLVDVDPALAEEGKKRYGYARCATDWHELLDDPETNVIDICTPNDMHKEIVLEAVKRGKHVFCEKPLSVSAEDALEMYEAAKAAGVVHAVGHNNRAMSAVRLLKLLIDRGDLGEIYSFQMRYIQSWGLSPETPMQWRFDAGRAGSGALGDIGSHAIDISRYLLGDLKRVSAEMKTIVKERAVVKNALLTHSGGNGEPTAKQAVDVDDDVKALIEFESGVTATLWASRFCIGQEDTLDIEVYGSEGAAKFSRERPNQLEFYSGSDSEDVAGFRTIKMGPAQPYGEMWPMADLGIGYVEQKCIDFKHFFEAVAEGDPSRVNVDFYGGYKVCQAIDAIKKSAAECKWVELKEI